MPGRITIEICAYSVDSAIAAQSAGADRIELCASAEEGGITPSRGAIDLARESLHIPLHVIVRPRGGDFLYTGTEFAEMQRDIAYLREAGADGIACGILTADGHVDTDRCRDLARLASPMSFTFHRAFDFTADPLRALEDIIACGCSRILTSGQQASAEKGADLIAELVKRAGDRIAIMPGGGISDGNLPALIRRTGAREFHASARKTMPSAMRFRNPKVSIGSSDDQTVVVDAVKVERLCRIAHEYQ